jgi:putative ABC transport system permease protein
VALATHRVRAGLAIAGTAIGVAGVMVLTAIGEGARLAVLRRVESLGRNMLVVSAGKAQSRPWRALQGEAESADLSVDDATAIVRASQYVVRAAPGQDRGMRAKYGPIQNPTTVLGTTPEWREIRQFPLALGRFFTHQEDHRRDRVAVLGSAARISLFPDTASPLGRTIRIGRVPFRVIGVLASKGVSVDGTATEDDRIVVPLETAMRRLFNVDHIGVIYLEVETAAMLPEARREVKAILRARRDLPPFRRDAFTVQDQRVLLAAELAARTSFQRLITGLGSLSLLVGGVGILSVMLLSVRERRPEIGLRVAVGARRGDIGLQFLAEAALLAAAGGMAGMLLGAGVAELLGAVTTWEVVITGRALGVAAGSVLAIAIGFGVVPAWRAAALDPVAALTGEV